jgi:hypothetical protein
MKSAEAVSYISVDSRRRSLRKMICGRDRQEPSTQSIEVGPSKFLYPSSYRGMGSLRCHADCRGRRALSIYQQKPLAAACDWVQLTTSGSVVQGVSSFLDDITCHSGSSLPRNALLGQPLTTFERSVMRVCVVAEKAKVEKHGAISPREVKLLALMIGSMTPPTSNLH